MNQYIYGVSWFFLVSVVSSLNDALIKWAGVHLPGIQVAFLRFFFSALVLLPFVLRQGKGFFQGRNYFIHGVRSFFLFLALAPWCYGVIQLPLSLVTTLSFTTPLFVLVLSAFFLKEKLGTQRVLATLVGFGGIILSTGLISFGWENTALLLVLSTILFAALDVINKKLLIENEDLLSMLFFSAMGTTLLGAPFAMVHWVSPSMSDIGALFFLGIGANLILYCLLKAFQYAELSSLQPMRYLELLVSSAIGFLVFQEVPSRSTAWGAALIIVSTLYIARFELSSRKRKDAFRSEEK